MLITKAVFMPKKDTSVIPADFRLISTASAVMQYLHKIFTERLREANLSTFDSDIWTIAVLRISQH